MYPFKIDKSVYPFKKDKRVYPFKIDKSVYPFKKDKRVYPFKIDKRVYPFKIDKSDVALSSAEVDVGQDYTRFVPVWHTALIFRHFKQFSIRQAFSLHKSYDIAPVNIIFTYDLVKE